MKNLKLTLLSVLVTYLCFYASAIFMVPPYSVFIEKPVQAAKALMHKYMLIQTKHPDVFWGYPRDERKGLVLYNADKAFDGYTFFSSSWEQTATLVDMKGNIIHQWTPRYNDIWPSPRHVASIVPEHLQLLTRAHLYPNGDILAIYTGVGSTPLGYGLARIDRNSKTIWAYDDAIHHDAEITEDGTIYTISHKIRTAPYEGLNPYKANPPVYEDFLVVLSPEGELIKEISFFDLFKNSPDQKNVLEKLRRDHGTDTPAGDMLHPNALEIVPAHLAGKAPMLKEGHILVSFRNLSMLAMIDPTRESITWSMFLPARFQHDPRFLDDGTIILFDNQGHTGPGEPSRVLRVDLNNAAILWSYAGTESEPLFSPFHSSVDPLPNGNILITESLAGRLLEVTPEKEIVWDYRSPWRANEGGIEKVPAFYRARRFRAEDLTFINQSE